MKEINLQKKVAISLGILIIASIIFSVYYLFFYAEQCTTGECFTSAIGSCKKVYWVREDVRASWLYTIKGNSENGCGIEVVLLKIKEGTIANEKLEGQNMICSVKKSGTRYPEEDLSKCTGILKESLQETIIQRMHNYLLENVGQIAEGFEVNESI